MWIRGHVNTPCVYQSTHRINNSSLILHRRPSLTVYCSVLTSNALMLLSLLERVGAFAQTPSLNCLNILTCHICLSSILRLTLSLGRDMHSMTLEPMSFDGFWPFSQIAYFWRWWICFNPFNAKVFGQSCWIMLVLTSDITVLCIFLPLAVGEHKNLQERQGKNEK